MRMHTDFLRMVRQSAPAIALLTLWAACDGSSPQQMQDQGVQRDGQQASGDSHAADSAGSEDGWLVADYGPAADGSSACRSNPDDPAVTAYWRVGEWGECNATCGTGRRTRSVACVRCSDNTPVANKTCVAQKPAANEPCEAATACDYAYGDWSAWASCVNKQRTRTRECRRGDGTSVECSLCGDQCTETEDCCQDRNIAAGPGASGKAICEAAVQDSKASCLADGCNWGGPETCTVGGSVSSATGYGVLAACN